LQLFEQLGKRVSLTQAGKAFLRYAEDIIASAEQLESVVDDLRETPSGQLRLAATSTAAIHLLPAVLSSFRKNHGKTQILLDVCKVDEIVPGILINTWDFGVIVSTIRRPDLSQPELDVHEFLSDEMVFIVGRDHPWVGRSSVPVAELAGQPFVLPKQGSDIRTIVQEEIMHHGIAIDAVMETNNSEVMKHVVQCAPCIAIVTRWSVSGEEIESRRLSIFRVPGVPLQCSVYLLSHRRKYQSAALRAFSGLVLSSVSSIRQNS
jgi:DNA-binding transcriptional LysR family regulator